MKNIYRNNFMPQNNQRAIKIHLRKAREPTERWMGSVRREKKTKLAVASSIKLYLFGNLKSIVRHYGRMNMNIVAAACYR